MTMTFNESRWPRENAIKVVKGNGVSKLAVFMDPMCVYCKRLSRETLANLMNVSHHLLLHLAVLKRRIQRDRRLHLLQRRQGRRLSPLDEIRSDAHRNVE